MLLFWKEHNARRRRERRRRRRKEKVTTQDKKKECLLAGVLSKEGYKILHLDRNAYYGAEKESSQKSLFINFNSELLLLLLLL